jgi:O-antigen ligase
MGILMTGSRSGWLLLMLATALVVFIAPIAKWTKIRILGGGGSALLVMLVILLAQGGSSAERVRSLTDSESVLGLRQQLIEAGWAMFTDNPVHGVGTGGYERALVTSYFDLLPGWSETTLSHTSLISTLAELGLIGLVMFGFAGAKAAVAAVRTYSRTRDPFDRLLAGWAGVAIFGVVLHSQSEGRLLDDPFLWYYLMLLVVMEVRHRAVPARAMPRERPHPRAVPAEPLAAAAVLHRQAAPDG